RSSRLRTAAIVFVMLGAGFIFLAQSAAAQTERTELVVGLQNDMTTMDFFNPETNTVWNAYQVEWGFEGLFSCTPDNLILPVLANPAKVTSGTGYTSRDAPPARNDTVDVYSRPALSFHEGPR